MAGNKEKVKEKAKVTSVDVGKAISSGEVATFKFVKSQIIKSKKYAHCRDALNALLKDDEAYSFAKVDEILNTFYKGVN